MRSITVIGFGKIGQALAAHLLTDASCRVHAVDLNETLVASFSAGTYRSLEPEVERLLTEAFKEGRLLPTTDFSCVQQTQAVLVCIPLLVDADLQPDMRSFTTCLRAFAPFLQKGCLVSVETTLPAGWSRSILLPALEESGKKHGRDFFLVHSPERIKSGSMLAQLASVPKVVGGLDAAALDRGLEIYRRFFRNNLHAVSSIEAAELIKLAGITYRDLNIAFSNELAQLCHRTGADIQEIIRWANTDGEAALLQPGIGVGGHCTPIYPYFLIDNFKKHRLSCVLAQEGRRINDSMAEFCVNMALEQVPEMRSVLILGLAFRPRVPEDTCSTTFLLEKSLRMKGIRTWVHDPYFSVTHLRERGLEPCTDLYATPGEALFLVTAHPEYKNLNFSRLCELGFKVFVDGRNFFDRQRVESQGLKYIGVGR